MTARDAFSRKVRAMLYLILILILVTLFIIAMTLLMIGKYYWGPTGRPPEYHYRDKETEPRKTDSETTASTGP